MHLKSVPRHGVRAGLFPGFGGGDGLKQRGHTAGIRPGATSSAIGSIDTSPVPFPPFSREFIRDHTELEGATKKCQGIRAEGAAGASVA